MVVENKSFDENWELFLWWVISKNNYCRCISHASMKIFSLVGIESNVNKVVRHFNWYKKEILNFEDFMRQIINLKTVDEAVRFYMKNDGQIDDDLIYEPFFYATKAELHDLQETKKGRSRTQNPDDCIYGAISGLNYATEEAPKEIEKINKINTYIVEKFPRLEYSHFHGGSTTSVLYQLQALLGRDLGIDVFGGKNANGTTLGGTGLAKNQLNLKDYGVDYAGGSALQYEIAQKQGNGNFLGRNAENVLAAQNGLGVSKEVSFGLMELSRSTRENQDNFLKTIGGVLTAGQNNIFKGDRTFLNEFLGSFRKLATGILSTTETVRSGALFDILSCFNGVGGAFSARDSRSLPLIEGIQSSLTNPGNDYQKAFSFLSLRQAYPEYSTLKILEEQQKGLSSPKYLSSVLRNIKSMGGQRDFQVMNVAGMLGLSGNLAAAERIYDHSDDLINGKISANALGVDGNYDEDAVRKLGKGQTSPYTKSSNEIQNKFIEDVGGAVELVGSKMVDLFGNMIDKIEDYIDARLSGKNGTPIYGNTTRGSRTAKQAAKTAWYMPGTSPIGGSTW